jgi:shikimate dehydrogenase
MRPPISRDTTLCMSLSARPGTFGTRFHNRLYDVLGLDYVYKAFTTTDLPAAIGGIRALGIRGCAISMPFKAAVIPLLDGIEPSALAIDAVNTIVNDGGRLTGYNTDYSAVASLLRARGIATTTRFALQGSGGMAKAVAAALRDVGFRAGVVLARNEATGRGLADRYGFGWRAELGDDRPGLLINATPLGMTGPQADQLAFSREAIAAADVVFDVVAVPPETPLLAEARRQGKAVITGIEVQVLQGVEQFALYTGVRPDDAAVADAAAYAGGA